MIYAFSIKIQWRKRFVVSLQHWLLISDKQATFSLIWRFWLAIDNWPMTEHAEHIFLVCWRPRPHFSLLLITFIGTKAETATVSAAKTEEIFILSGFDNSFCSDMVFFYFIGLKYQCCHLVRCVFTSWCFQVKCDGAIFSLHKLLHIPVKLLIFVWKSSDL